MTTRKEQRNESNQGWVETLRRSKPVGGFLLALSVYESGNLRADLGSFAPGDRLRIEVRYGVVRYRHHGAVLCTSVTTPQYPFRVDTSLHDQGATLGDVRVGSIVWASEVAASVAASTLNKTDALGWTSGAVSTNTIEASDGFMKFTATEADTTRVAGLSTRNTLWVGRIWISA